MTTISTTAHIGDDRRLVVDLPDDIPTGTHRVTLTLPPEPTASDDATGEPPFRLKGNVLVFTGTPEDESVDIVRLIEQVREDRERAILSGSDGP